MSNSARFRYWFQYHHKKIYIISALLISALALFMFRVWAEPEDNILVKTAIGMLESIADNSQYDTISNLLEVSVTDGGSSIGGHEIGGLSEIVSSLNNSCQSLATMIIVITFGIGLFNSMVTQTVSMELVVKKFLVLVACIFLVTEAMNISFAICGLGNTLSNKIAASSATVNDISSFKATMLEACSQEPDKVWYSKIVTWCSNNVTTPLSFILVLFPPYIIQKITWILVKVVCISRGIEVVVLCALSPLACCMVHEGTNSFGNGSATRLFKNIGAVALQGAIIILIMKVTAGLTIGTFDVVFENGMTASALGDAAWTSCFASIASCGLCMKSLSIAQRALGLQ